MSIKEGERACILFLAKSPTANGDIAPRRTAVRKKAFKKGQKWWAQPTISIIPLTPPLEKGEVIKQKSPGVLRPRGLNPKYQKISNQSQVAQKVPDARRREARNEAYSVCTPQLRATKTTKQMGLFEAPSGKAAGSFETEGNLDFYSLA
ncbi:MAG: hypothetical protein A2V53_00570 [Deltaproteobacteria bacterium RBG_19FT_COMBO_56_10]|nr:MAG: hypothetical protein A2V53_00570 [Deltaproteobacteria bacterium RBG_19FT_COMBO_56_10]